MKKTVKELQKEIVDLEQRQNEVTLKLEVLKKQEEELNKEIYHLKCKVMVMSSEVKEKQRQKRKKRKEARKLEQENVSNKRQLTKKKRKIERMKKNFYEQVTKRKDFTTTKYGPEVLKELGKLELTNDNNNGENGNERKN